jgi:FMN phosphatase YigB (HAD superfamily)
MNLPHAILFDLDDTIPVAFGPRSRSGNVPSPPLPTSSGRSRRRLLRRRSRRPRRNYGPIRRGTNTGSHRPGGARRRIVATAFTALAAASHLVPTEAIGDALADAYNALHDEELSLFPDAHETLDRLKDNAMRRRKQLQQYSGRRGDAHDWFPRPMAGTSSNAVILRSACS